MPEGRHEKGGTHRASRGSRHHAAARGVCDDHTALRPARLAGDRPHRGSGCRAGVVSPDLSHRAEDRPGMVEVKPSAVSRRLAAWLVLLAGPLSGQTSLSIYSDGRVVVRRTVPQALEKGRTSLTLRLDGLDPATLFSPDTSVGLVSAIARPSTDRDAALQHAVGQTLAFVRQRSDGRSDTVRATVVRVTPPQYRLSDGRFLVAEPGEPLFPPDLVRTVPEVAVVVEATRPRPKLDLAYVTTGAMWEAVYQVVLTGAGCQLSGAATITSQSLRADTAEVQLVAGAVDRKRGVEGKRGELGGGRIIKKKKKKRERQVQLAEISVERQEEAAVARPDVRIRSVIVRGPSVVHQHPCADAIEEEGDARAEL